ncbi:TIR domain-containing protein [Acetobacteraceae bacterium]|nr:TIR domain-containing protein [Acetobacteraceae bacterium]
MTVRAFLSYAVKDKAGAREVEKQCEAFTQSGRLEILQDTDEKRALTVSAEKKKQIENADIFIALFTQDYVYNGACRDELYIALQLHLAGKLSLLPIAWKECHWTSISGTIQRLTLPKDKRIVTYAEGWKKNPKEPWDQILNRLSLYLQKAECLSKNPDYKAIPTPIIKTSQDILKAKPVPLPANEAISVTPLKNSEKDRQEFVRQSLQTICWIFQKRLLKYQEENPALKTELSIHSETHFTAKISDQDKSLAEASLTVASRSDPVAIKMGSGLPPSLLCYHEGTLKDGNFAISMGEFLLTGNGRMEISNKPSCILEVIEGPSSLGWGRSKKQRSNIRTKLSIAERPSKNGFTPEEMANIFWEFFEEQLEIK